MRIKTAAVIYMFKILEKINCCLLYFYITSVVPPHPTTVSAVPVDRSGVIKMSWTAPVVPTGELPITGYSIRYQIKNSGVSGYQYMSAMQSPAEVTGLLPGTEYRVFVASVNAIGRGGYCCELSSLFVRTYIGKY